MVESNVKQMPDRIEFVPNTTLGRGGYAPCKQDILGGRVEQLDALLILIADTSGEDNPQGFQNLNDSIQAAVLRLASSLATEIHEIHEELFVERFNASPRL